MSLRAKLFLLVGLAISLAAMPIIYFSRAYILDSGISQERDAFAHTVTIMEDGIIVRYLYSLTAEIDAVLDAKTDLKQMAEIIAGIIKMDSTADPVRSLKKWKDAIMRDCSIAIFDRNGDPLMADLLIRMAWASDVTDYKGQSVRSMLKPRSKNRSDISEFAVVRIPDKEGNGEKPVLMCFKPVAGAMLVLAMPVMDTKASRNILQTQMIKGIRAHLENLESKTGTSIAVLDSKGRILAGKTEGAVLAEIPEEVIKKVRTGQTVEGTTDDDLYRLAYFKALDWYIMASIPMEAITAPAQTLTQRLILAAACLLIVSLAIMLALSMRLIAPLRLLTAKAGALAVADLGDGKEKNALEEIAKGLPQNRNDEVGQLAKAFSHMSSALSDNIKKLVETTAASQRMQGELNAAHEIQTGILPPPSSAPRDEHWKAGAFLHPAKEVGGDFYDFFTAPDGRMAVVIGDVSDKGVPAALFMSMTVTLVRYAIADGLDCAHAMRRINDLLAENNPSCMFVTMFIGLFDPGTGTLEYASGAHCPPFIFGGDSGKTVRKITETSGPLVGAMEGMDYAGHTARLEPGQSCLLYTDGISEALNSTMELFGEDRLETLLGSIGGETPDQVIKKVYDAVVAHRGEAPQSDDITMLCFKRMF